MELTASDVMFIVVIELYLLICLLLTKRLTSYR